MLAKLFGVQPQVFVPDKTGARYSMPSTAGKLLHPGWIRPFSRVPRIMHV